MNNPCPKCNGKGFVNADGSPVNAFEGSDTDPVLVCGECGGLGFVIDSLDSFDTGIYAANLDKQEPGN